VSEGEEWELEDKLWGEETLEEYWEKKEEDLDKEEWTDTLEGRKEVQEIKMKSWLGNLQAKPWLEEKEVVEWEEEQGEQEDPEYEDVWD
jgi:hypothetical protein